MDLLNSPLIHPDEPVPVSLGPPGAAPLTEGYAALRESAAWCDVSARGRIVVRGDDRARLLHAMTTNDVQHLAPGQGCYAFFLNAQGRILADVDIFCFPDRLLLDTEPETRTKVYEHLDRYIIADDVTLEDVTDQTGSISLEGPTAGAVLEQLGLTLPAGFGANSAGEKVGEKLEDTIVARLDTPSPGSPGPNARRAPSFLLIVPVGSKEILTAQLAAAGVPEAQPQDARTVRIEQGRPRYGEEITERYLVQETGQLHAVSFSKGCYLGQEIVERVRSRAQIHRVLRRLEIDTAQPLTLGSKLRSGDADAGEIASAAFSPALGKTAALAYVRTAVAEPGTDLTLDGTIARVTG
jgi:tRNA-modifying protein YgfZ